MTTTVTKEAPMERYRVRGEGGLWATIALRGWETPAEREGPHYGGELLINSDYGNWAYSWGNMGSPLKRFLLRIDRGYLLNKLAGRSLHEFDFDASVTRLKREIIEQRRSRSIDRDEARNAWWDIPTDNQGKDLFINAIWQCNVFGDEPWHFVEERESPTLTGFYRDIWTPFLEHLRAELQEAA